jgi:uncharacterized protein YggE
MKNVILLAVFLFSTPVFAQDKNELQTINVLGESTIKVIPDYVVIKVRVEETANTVEVAKKKHDIGVDGVLKFLKKMKLDTKDYSTQYINLNKVYDYNTKVYNYNANQSINIVLRDLTKYEKLIQGLLENGINRIDGIQFASTEIEKHQTDVRKLAILNAKTKALEYVGELGQIIGKAIHISEFQNNPTPMYNTKLAFNETLISDGSIETIAIGEIVISSKISVSFELK